MKMTFLKWTGSAPWSNGHVNDRIVDISTAKNAAASKAMLLHAQPMSAPFHQTAHHCQPRARRIARGGPRSCREYRQEVGQAHFDCTTNDVSSILRVLLWTAYGR